MLNTLQAPSSQKVLTVAVTLPVNGAFDYTLPNHMEEEAKVGCRVTVPFGAQVTTGYILEKTPGIRRAGLKQILEIQDGEPLFHPNMVPFFQWMADYYLYPIGRFIQSSLPSGLNTRSVKTASLTEEGERIMAHLPPHSEEWVALMQIKSAAGYRLPIPLSKAYGLERKGWITVEQTTKKRRTGPLIRTFVRVKKGIEEREILREKEGSFKAANESAFLEMIFSSQGLSIKELALQFKNSRYLISKWIKKGVLERYEAAVYRNSGGQIFSPSPVPRKLFKQQRDVLTSISAGLNNKAFSTCLLYGVTGSGKTEVYYRAIEHVIGQGQQVILMVPEIALAVYMESQFRVRLGERMAVYHSGLSEGERFDAWMRMVRGEVDLVIGARSAVFSPFPHLGLIIVDEEHDFSYKQEESPAYQSRDAAVVRGRLEGAFVLLGSGTPSIQSYHNAQIGKYKLLTMPHRIEKRPLPTIQTVDMKAIPDNDPNQQIISPQLSQALDQTMDEGKQAILFLNKRGFNRVYLCRYCGHTIRCHNCDLSLIYHLQENHLACHYCGFHTSPLERCPSCRRDGMLAFGFGTEKLEEELKNRYPKKKIARMDRDTTRRKGQTFQVLKRFSQGEIDIIVGTQMVTKGYDFPDVTLVGVVAADSSLGFPDFRAGERTFQILSQVAGRAGRGDWGGKVVVQTFNPAHYAITTAKDHDYLAFFHKEQDLRSQLGYPPFSHLAGLRLQGNVKRKTAEITSKVGRGMVGILDGWPKKGKDIQLLGPVEAPLSKLKGKYRWQILVKSKGAALLHYYLGEVRQMASGILKSEGVTMIMDVDPYHML
jgi:primosomal protein N' (replication factor Y)